MTSEVSRCFLKRAMVQSGGFVVKWEERVGSEEVAGLKGLVVFPQGKNVFTCGLRSDGRPLGSGRPTRKRDHRWRLMMSRGAPSAPSVGSRVCMLGLGSDVTGCGVFLIPPSRIAASRACLSALHRARNALGGIRSIGRRSFSL